MTFSVFNDYHCEVLLRRVPWIEPGVIHWQLSVPIVGRIERAVVPGDSNHPNVGGSCPQVMSGGRWGESHPKRGLSCLPRWVLRTEFQSRSHPKTSFATRLCSKLCWLVPSAEFNRKTQEGMDSIETGERTSQRKGVLALQMGLFLQKSVVRTFHWTQSPVFLKALVAFEPPKVVMRCVLVDNRH